ncbi:MAG TPA: DUF4241 domain-containing protein [Ktedonobacteraceae bacterium]
MNTNDLWQSLKESVQIEDWSLGMITLHQRQLGELVLSTGQVVACDPLVFAGTQPFQKTIPPGRYPVFASVATFLENSDQRIAYALLQLDTREPVRWELATVDGEDISSLEEDKSFGYVVDSGIGCFMDKDAAEELRRRLAAESDYAERIIKDFYYSHGRGLYMELNPPGSANVVLFASGWGDGVYASYWGYDTAGRAVCLVTNFAVIGGDDDDDDE